MGRETPASKESLLIEGDFAPSQGARLARVTTLGLLTLLVVAFIAVVGVYGVVVFYESDINATSKQTRLMNEELKDLQVKLNRLQSYDKVSQAAALAPHLQEAAEIIEIDARHQTVRLASPVARTEPYPKTYGY